MDDGKVPVPDQIFALPTWCINNLVYPFLSSNHIWKKHKQTPPLDIWSKWRTPLTTLYDTLFWLLGCVLLVALLGMWFKSIVGV